MMKLRSHRRLNIPNSLAIFATLLLLVSSVVGFEANQETYSSGQEVKTSANADNGNDVVKHRSRGLNLGLLLFRRG